MKLTNNRNKQLQNILMSKLVSIKFKFQSAIKHLFIISIVFIVLFMIYFQYSIKFDKKIQRTPAVYNSQLKSKINSSSLNNNYSLIISTLSSQSSYSQFNGWNLYDKIMQKLTAKSKPEFCPLIPPNLGN